jgi:hypothetical protein
MDCIELVRGDERNGAELADHSAGTPLFGRGVVGSFGRLPVKTPGEGTEMSGDDDVWQKEGDSVERSGEQHAGEQMIETTSSSRPEARHELHHEPTVVILSSIAARLHC